MGIPLIFWGHLPFSNRNSYDFSCAHKYELLLREKADYHGILQREFRPKFFENFGFICFFNWNSYDFSSAHKYELLLWEKADDRGILQEFWSEKQSTFPIIIRKFKNIHINAIPK